MLAAIIAARQNAYRYNKYRRSFYLDFNDKQYIREHGYFELEKQAYTIISNRLKNTPDNDGKQTPYYGSPIFKAQHATGCCCRACVQKLHEIPKYRELSDTEINHLVNTVMLWIKKQMTGVA
jgi:exodeoxyribonuclease V alpha subunit